MKPENYRARCKWRKALTGTVVTFNDTHGRFFGTRRVRLADSDLKKLPGPKSRLP